MMEERVKAESCGIDQYQDGYERLVSRTSVFDLAEIHDEGQEHVGKQVKTYEIHQITDLGYELLLRYYSYQVGYERNECCSQKMTKAVCDVACSLVSVDEREDNANKQDRSHKYQFSCKQ